MANVFISYSSEDRDVASRISKSLKSQGLSVFLDMDSLVAGVDYSQRITDAVSKADAVLVLLSANSKRARWVEHELESALEQEKIVVPILLDSDAKNNWVWPLVSDRRSVSVDDNTNYELLGRELKAAFDRSETPMPTGVARGTNRRTSLMFVGAVILVALLSTIVMFPRSALPTASAVVKVLDADGNSLRNVTISLDENGELITTDAHGEATIPIKWLGRSVTLRNDHGQELKSTILPTDAGKVVLLRVPK